MAVNLPRLTPDTQFRVRTQETDLGAMCWGATSATPSPKRSVARDRKRNRISREAAARRETIRYRPHRRRNLRSCVRGARVVPG